MKIKLPPIITHKIEKIFKIDLRSLAVFRMGLGLMLLATIIIRIPHIKTFYTEQGVFPFEAVWSFYKTSPPLWSLYFLNGTYAFQACLFLLTGIYAFALMIGYRSRIAVIISWILLLSLHNRNTLVINSGDQLFSLLLFWSLFLPIHKKSSIDSLSPSKKNNDNNHEYSIASVAILLQVSFMYFITGIHKLNYSWMSGRTMNTLLTFSPYRSELSEFLLHFPVLLKITTILTPFIQISGAVFLLSPFCTKHCRYIFLPIFLLFHIMIILFIKVGLFSYFCILGLILFIPGEIWDKLLSSAHLKNTGLAMTMKTSVMSRVKNLLLINSKDATVKKISTTHHRSSGKTSGNILLFTRGPATQVLCFLCLLYVILWNACMLGKILKINKNSIENSRLSPIGAFLALNQRWMMFAFDNVYWMQIEGTTKDQSQLNLLTQKPHSEFPKKNTLAACPNSIWCEFNYKLVTYKGRKIPFKSTADYYCIEWNRAHSGREKLLSIKIYQSSRIFLKLPSVKTPKPLFRKSLLWEEACP